MPELETASEITGNLFFSCVTQIERETMEFSQDNSVFVANTFFHKDLSTPGLCWMDNTEIKLNACYANKGGEALVSQQKKKKKTWFQLWLRA